MTSSLVSRIASRSAKKDWTEVCSNIARGARARTSKCRSTKRLSFCKNSWSAIAAVEMRARIATLIALLWLPLAALANQQRDPELGPLLRDALNEAEDCFED